MPHTNSQLANTYTVSVPPWTWLLEKHTQLCAGSFWQTAEVAYMKITRPATRRSSGRGKTCHERWHLSTCRGAGCLQLDLAVGCYQTSNRPTCCESRQILATPKDRTHKLVCKVHTACSSNPSADPVSHQQDGQQDSADTSTPERAGLANLLAGAALAAPSLRVLAPLQKPANTLRSVIICCCCRGDPGRISSGLAVTVCWLADTLQLEASIWTAEACMQMSSDVVLLTRRAADAAEPASHLCTRPSAFGASLRAMAATRDDMGAGFGGWAGKEVNGCRRRLLGGCGK
jgi:hypothetical protein